MRVSLGHSAATVSEARAGYAAGAVTTTHLFNAMVGVVHRESNLLGSIFKRPEPVKIDYVSSMPNRPSST